MQVDPLPPGVTVVGYARLSTAEQARGLTLEQQVSRLRDAGAQEVLVDLMSGRTTARPNYRRLMQMVEARQVGRVVATRLDRLSRGASETVRLSEVFSEDGAPQLQLLDDPGLDLTTVGGRMQMRMIGVVCAGEVERTSERSAAGKAHRAAKGWIDTAPLGQRVIAGKLENDDRPWLSTLDDQKEWSRADAVRALFDEVESGTQFSGWKFFWERFCIDLSRAGVARLILNPALRGARVGGRIKNGSQHSWTKVAEGEGGKALIDPDRHRALEARLRGERARNVSRDTRRAHALTSKVFCGHCGRRLARKNMTGRAAGKGNFGCVNPHCGWAIAGKRRNSCSEHRLMEAVLKELAANAEGVATALQGSKEAKAATALNTAEAAKLQQRRSTLLEMQAEGGAGLEPALAAIDRQLSDLSAAAVAAAGGDDDLAALRRDLYDGLPEIPRDRKVLAHLWGDGPKFTAYIRSLFELGTDFWLYYKPDGFIFENITPDAVKDVSMRWIGRFVRRVEVTEKEISSIELNL